MKDLVESFRFPEQGFKPIKVPTKENFEIFYQALKGPRDRTLFLVFASSGLRHSEVLSLDRFENVNFEKRMLTPNMRARPDICLRSRTLSRNISTV
jgi:integrase